MTKSKMTPKIYHVINWPILQKTYWKLGRSVYCEWCWNFINQKKWVCEKCGARGTHRDEHIRKNFTCPNCYKLVKLEVK